MAKLRDYSDEALLKLLRQEGLEAFEEIYRRYWKRLYSMSYKRVQSREIAEELVQDIFTSLWVAKDNTSIENLSGYLFSAIKYKVINHFARELSRKSYTERQLAVVKEDNSTEEKVLLDDLEGALQEAIGKLPAKRQQIFKLHRQENLSIKQVASQLGISEKTVENQYGKAMKMLKLNLKHFTWFSFRYSCLTKYFECSSSNRYTLRWLPLSHFSFPHTFHKYFYASGGNDLVTWLTLLNPESIETSN